MSEAVAETPAVEAPVTEPDTPADEPLREPGKKALEAERARADALERELKGIKAAQMTELERAQAEANEARTQLEQITRQNLRNSVALAKGVPADLVEFLTGDTEDEVAAKADVLLSRLAAVNAPTTPKPDLSQGAKGNLQAASTGDKFAAQLGQLLDHTS